VFLIAWSGDLDPTSAVGKGKRTGRPGEGFVIHHLDEQPVDFWYCEVAFAETFVLESGLSSFRCVYWTGFCFRVLLVGDGHDGGTHGESRRVLWLS
jgi:hypothetical protein